MTNGKMISVEVPFEESGEKGTWTGTNCFWAVKPPEDKDQFHNKETGETTDSSPVFRTSWRVMGSVDVQIHDKEDLAGIRELLDRIEENLDD